MAEIFSEGTNYIWYRTANFTTGVVVTVKFRKPDDTLLEPVSVPESADEGVHRLCYDFNELGQWFGIFFEGGVKTSSSVFHIVPKTSSTVPYEGETMKCETCAHWTVVRGKDYGICDLVTNGNPYRRPDDTCPSYQDKSTG